MRTERGIPPSGVARPVGRSAAPLVLRCQASAGGGALWSGAGAGGAEKCLKSSFWWATMTHVISQLIVSTLLVSLKSHNRYYVNTLARHFSHINRLPIRLREHGLESIPQGRRSFDRRFEVRVGHVALVTALVRANVQIERGLRG